MYVKESIYDCSSIFYLSLIRLLDTEMWYKPYTSLVKFLSLVPKQNHRKNFGSGLNNTGLIPTKVPKTDSKKEVLSFYCENLLFRSRL